MILTIGDFIGLAGAIALVAASFFAMKDFFRDRIEKLKDDLNELKLENARLKNRIDLQDAVIQSFKEQILYKFSILDSNKGSNDTRNTY